jgi:hypothetical protein
MPADFPAVLAALKPVFATAARRLDVAADSSSEYVLKTRSPSPFPQHKGHPLDFGSVRVGKAYVSLHLMPIYMSPTLMKGLSPALKKRMQGKSCFNFTTVPAPEIIRELRALTEASLAEWAAKKWL